MSNLQSSEQEAYCFKVIPLLCMAETETPLGQIGLKQITITSMARLAAKVIFPARLHMKPQWTPLSSSSQKYVFASDKILLHSLLGRIRLQDPVDAITFLHGND